MASIQKRGKTYQFTVSHTVNGVAKPIRKGGFKTKKETQIAAAEIEAQLSKGILPYLKSMPFDEYFEKWFKLYKSNLTKTTKLHYDYTFRVMKEYFGGKPLQEIKRHDYQLFLNNFGADKAKETVEKVNIHIRSCVQDAIEEQIILHGFTRKAVLNWSNPAKKPEEKHLNYFETKRLLEVIYSLLGEGLGYYLILLGLTSGARSGELVGLMRKDFDFKNNTITINKTWGYAKRHPEGLGPTKNEASISTIKLDKKTMNAFRRLFETITPNLYGLVFYAPESKYRVISNTNANKLLQKTLQELNIDPITMHGLRHTHASVLLYRKVDINYVSERLGHSTIETTYKHYSHVLKELREEEEKHSVETFENM